MKSSCFALFTVVQVSSDRAGRAQHVRTYPCSFVGAYLAAKQPRHEVRVSTWLGEKNLQWHVHFWWKIVKNERDILSLWRHSGTQNISHLKVLASKSIRTKFLSPIFCHSWEIRWFIFNELTVHSTRSPVKHCPISKRKIFPDSGDWALSSQACARKIWDIRAHPTPAATTNTTSWN